MEISHWTFEIFKGTKINYDPRDVVYQWQCKYTLSKIAKAKFTQKRLIGLAAKKALVDVKKSTLAKFV